MIVVSNSSPLIGLALIDHLELLPAFFGQIHIATATLVLIDERLARQFAQSKHLQILGTLGVLKYAHERGLLPDLQNTLDKLRAHGFRFSDSLYRQILAK